MEDPTVYIDGQTYERIEKQKWIWNTNVPDRSHRNLLVPNAILKSAMQQFFLPSVLEGDLTVNTYFTLRAMVQIDFFILLTR